MVKGHKDQFGKRRSERILHGGVGQRYNDTGYGYVCLGPVLSPRLINRSTIVVIAVKASLLCSFTDMEECPECRLIMARVVGTLQHSFSPNKSNKTKKDDPDDTHKDSPKLKTRKKTKKKKPKTKRGRTCCSDQKKVEKFDQSK